MKKKVLISVLAAVLSTVSLAGQEVWTIKRFEDYTATKQWDPDGRGIMWFGYYRSLTFSSLSDVYVDSVFIVKDHNTLKEAKDDFSDILFYYQRMEEEEEKIGRNKYRIYLLDYWVLIERRGKKVSLEFSQYTGEE